MSGARPENPFVFGEITAPSQFVDRQRELDELVRDLSDGQKLFLLSPRRFGKSSLVFVAFLKLQKQHVRTAYLDVSSYASYALFLQKFAEKIMRAAGPWDRVKDWVSRFVQRVKPEARYDLSTGEVQLSFGRETPADPALVAPDVFALPGELAKNGDFRVAICLDEFQQIQRFDSGSVEAALRSEVQKQRLVGYVFSGSQPSVMEQMLAPKRPFHKAGPRVFLEKIPAGAWKAFVESRFQNRRRIITESALNRLLSEADLIPYDVQRLAHELWDYAELAAKTRLQESDVETVVGRLVSGQSTYYERLWQQLSLRQRAVLSALALEGGDSALMSEDTRQKYRLGAASTVQKALQALTAQDIVDRYQGAYFFLDPLFGNWIRRKTG